jgi:hypothetical protein
MYKTFLETVLPTQGTYTVVGLHGGKPQQRYSETLEDAYKEIEKFKARAGTDVYYAVGSFEGFSRKAVDSIYFKSFFLDLDCGEGKDFPSQGEALEALAKFIVDVKLPEPTLVSSGYGVHVYWILDKEIPTKQWLGYAKKLKDLCTKKGLKADPAVTSDAARILRVPGTKNYKKDTPVDVEIMNDVHTCTLDEIVAVLGEVKEEQTFDLSQVRGTLDDETRKMLGLDNYEFSFERIAIESLEGRGCSHIRHAIINAADLPEPLWVAGISVAARCVDRDTAIHQLSEDHKDYNAEETERRADRTVNEAKWAYSCKAFEDRFRDANPGGCDNCPWKGKIPSPTHIGKRLRIAQPGSDDASIPGLSGQDEAGDHGDDGKAQENGAVSNKFPKEYLSFPDFLFPFIRPAGGGVYYQPPPEHKKDGTAVPKNPIRILAHDFVPIKRLYSQQDGEALHMRLFLPMDKMREFILPMSVVYAPERFKDFISKSGVLVMPKDLEHFRDYLVKWGQYLVNMQKAEDMRMQMGWTHEPENGSFVVGTKEITPSGTFDCPVSPIVKNIASYLHESGDFEEWKTAANALNAPGFELHALGMLMGFGSPLMKFTPATGLVVSFCGKGGAGKTGAMHAGLSVFGDPIRQKIVTERGATQEGLFQRASTLGSLMMGIDEVSNMKPERLSELIYKAPMNNVGKIRLQSSYNVERKSVEGSTILTLLTTNQSSTDKMFVNKDDPSGELRRLMEIDIYKHYGKMEETLGVKIFNPYKTHYGLAGPRFIDACYHIGIPEVVRNTSKWHDRILHDFVNDSNYTYWNGGLAAMLSAGEIATKFDILNYDIERIYQVVLDQLHALHRERLQITVSYEDIISEYVMHNINSMLAFNGTKLSTEPRTGKLSIRCEVDEGKIWIVKKDLKEYLRERQVNVTHFETELIRKKIMLNKQERKRMGAGWKDAMGSFNVNCYEFQFDLKDVIADISGQPEQDN